MNGSRLRAIQLSTLTELITMKELVVVMLVVNMVELNTFMVGDRDGGAFCSSRLWLELVMVELDT